jgi:hypothetical protein
MLQEKMGGEANNERLPIRRPFSSTRQGDVTSKRERLGGRKLVMASRRGVADGIPTLNATTTKLFTLITVLTNNIHALNSSLTAHRDHARCLELLSTVNAQSILHP